MERYCTVTLSCVDHLKLARLRNHLSFAGLTMLELLKCPLAVPYSFTPADLMNIGEFGRIVSYFKTVTTTMTVFQVAGAVSEAFPDLLTGW